MGRIYRTPVYTTGPANIYSPYFANTSARDAVKELTKDFQPESAVWYLPDPITALDLLGRQILRESLCITAGDLAWEKFYASKPIQVRLLLPPSFENDGRAKAIRGSFVGARGLQLKRFPSANYVMWTAQCGPVR